MPLFVTRQPRSTLSRTANQTPLARYHTRRSIFLTLLVLSDHLSACCVSQLSVPAVRSSCIVLRSLCPIDFYGLELLCGFISCIDNSKRVSVRSCLNCVCTLGWLVAVVWHNCECSSYVCCVLLLLNIFVGYLG